MASKTLCPIRDIRGWQHYNNCPYTKSLFSKAGVSDVLSSSGRKERFFKALQKNIGSNGQLTKDVMKKTLGDFRHEVDSNQLYKLGAAILPGEKSRISIAKGASVSVNMATDRSPDRKMRSPANSSSLTDLKRDPESAAKFSPLRLRANIYRFQMEDVPSKKNESSFFRAMNATMKNKRN